MLSRLKVLIAVCLVLLSAKADAEDNPKEYLVKAAFIYNFVKFVEWPGDAAISKQKNINICASGDNPLSVAASVFKQASTANLSLSLLSESGWSGSPKTCHIVFVSKSNAGNVSGALDAVKGHPVLTVSDIDGFAQKGGMVEFTTQDGKVKLIVNTKAASAAGLKVDAQLLEIAQSVIR